MYLSILVSIALYYYSIYIQIYLRFIKLNLYRILGATTNVWKKATGNERPDNSRLYRPYGGKVGRARLVTCRPHK